MEEDVGYDNIPETLSRRKQLEVDSKERTFGTYITTDNYKLKVKAMQEEGREAPSGDPFEQWLKEYYVSVRK